MKRSVNVLAVVAMSLHPPPAKHSSLGGVSMEQDSHPPPSLAGLHQLAYKFSEKIQLCRYAPLICNDFGVGFAFHWYTCIYSFATL